QERDRRVTSPPVDGDPSNDQPARRRRSVRGPGCGFDRPPPQKRWQGTRVSASMPWAAALSSATTELASKASGPACTTAATSCCSCCTSTWSAGEKSGRSDIAVVNTWLIDTASAYVATAGF